MSFKNLRKYQKNLKKFALKEEISHEEVDKIRHYLNKKNVSAFHFDHMFENEWRDVIESTRANPLVALERTDALHLRNVLVNLEGNYGWSFDIKSGIAYKNEKQTNPKTGEVVNRRVEIKLGKLFQRTLTALKNSYGESRTDWELSNIRSHVALFARAVDIWNKYSEKIMTNNIIYIVSQHPIDVLRMSDFKAIQSCHSYGGSYFYCAREEAQGIGVVVYAITRKDYDKYKDRLQEDDFFEDKGFEIDDNPNNINPNRNIDGATPLARGRIRAVEIGGYGVQPIPEPELYGNNLPELGNIMYNWCKKSPEYTKITRLGRISREEIELLGGSYTDTNVKDLVESFYDVVVSKSYTSSEIREHITWSYLREFMTHVIHTDIDTDDEGYTITFSLAPYTTNCPHPVGLPDPSRYHYYRLMNDLRQAAGFRRFVQISEIEESSSADQLELVFDTVTFNDNYDSVGDITQILYRFLGTVHAEYEGACVSAERFICEHWAVEEEEE